MENSIANFAASTMNNILEVSQDMLSLMMDNFHELQDHAALVLSSSVGFQVVEHIVLDRTLHVFVVFGVCSGAYEGCALDAIDSLEHDDFVKAETVTYVTGSDKVAKDFYIELVTDCGMFIN